MSQSSSPPPPSSSPWALLPTSPGIYIYKNTRGDILYVGKAKSLRDRVRSYFAPPEKLGPKTARLVSEIHSIEHIEVGSEVEALLLESRLIKKFQPPFNISSKDDKSPYYIHLTREDYPRPVLNHESEKSVAGPFLNGYTAKSVLRSFRKIAPFCSSPRPVRRPCLYAHLGLCRPCPATGDKVGYQKNIARLKRLLSGQFSRVLSDLKSQMTTASNTQDFESAAALRNQITSLDYLLSQPVRPEDYIANPNLIADQNQEALNSLILALSTKHLVINSIYRIEFFDNAHLAGTAPTSAMTVAIDGQLSPHHYRHFTLKSHAGDDVAYMTEVLTRRLNRSDWPVPDLIVLDGGFPQLSAVKSQTPLIALAKREETIYFPDGQSLQLPLNHPGLRLLIRLRDEAHRFSRRLHHKHRSKMLK